MKKFLVRGAVMLAIVAAASLGFAETGQKVYLAQDAAAKAIVATMTLEEKIGQMTQPDQGSLKAPGDVEKYLLGSLLSGGGSGPKDPKNYMMAGWRDMVDAYQRTAMKTRLGIPLIYGVDAVHGHNNIPGATVFPHNIGLGCTRDAALVEKIEKITAEEVRATGINWVFAPCVTVPRDIRWGRTYEGFSEDPSIVKELGPAAVKGFQGKLDDPLSVVACIKHFVGDGGTTFGSATGKAALLDQGDTRVDEATLRKIHLQGYISSVEAGAGTVMPSYSSWNGVKCSASKELLTDILKKELGFEGFLISDYNALDQIDKDYKKCIEISINAGMDMVMLTERYPEFQAKLKELVTEGKVPVSRIDDAVTRILRVKLAMGLLEKGRSPLADRGLEKGFGSAEHRAVARVAVQESLVVLKNEKVLPLAKTGVKIVVAGCGADNLGMQCGGWTISWQGKMNQPIPGGTSIFKGIQEVAKGNTVMHSLDGTDGSGADVGIVVIGEQPYAEMNGDRAELVLGQVDQDTVTNMKNAGVKKIVLVVLSGRPLVLGDVMGKADAVVAAWLPGSEGAGVADVLFGDAKPVGKLGFEWPVSMEQLKAKVKGDASTPPLFKVGYGLGY